MAYLPLYSVGGILFLFLDRDIVDTKIHYIRKL